ncbi:stage II sporulation protein M [Paenibacillus lemnae]|uniref:Stage II sporulation protein M n=1 Tax=Paenibacillus lemnae TaxID=1330551 RepID=A0A848M9S0_PAELE|nr:stage II sporulation protein M [Paenibacillus lemnae]NMO96910.1 stage II sporulation protein M [Paenibacillus lemnae]
MLPFRQTFKDQLPLYVFVAVLFLVGVLFGALMVNALSLEQQQDLAGYLDHFFVNLHEGSEGAAPVSFGSVASLHLKWIGLIFLLGLSVVGLPGILVLDFLKGVLIGFAVGYMVGQYSWKGLLFALVSVAPQNVLGIPVLMMCSVAGIAFSLYIIRYRLLTQRGGKVTQPFTAYLTTTCIMAVLMLVVASFETWISPELMRWVAPMLLPDGSF